MSKKVKLYLGIFLIIAISILYFLKKENENPNPLLFNKSYIETSNNKVQYVPEQKTDYIFTTSKTEFDIKFIFLVVFLISAYLLYSIIKKRRKN
jgi:hypothetical protein